MDRECGPIDDSTLWNDKLHQEETLLGVSEGLFLHNLTSTRATAPHSSL